ncbi:MAG: polysaccharide deacetylase [Verrucomicrobia bacterium]|nr:MAG: polysaccharide deacetylase [Verrucomicrobiota bacterium]
MYRPFQQKSVSYMRLAPYRRIFREGVPILTYHRIGKPSEILPQVFERQMKEFYEEGFQTTKLEQWAEFKGPSNRRFVVTFDDGSLSVFQYAQGVLGRFGFSGIQFLVANFIGKKNEWATKGPEVGEPLMDKSEVRAWLAAGHAIGSHTLTHPNLARIDKKRAREEIFSSKKKLEDLFAIPIRHFCYPYGSWRQWVRDFVEEAGYETAVTTDPGICRNVTDAFALSRLDVGRRPRTLANFVSNFLPWTL